MWSRLLSPKSPNKEGRTFVSKPFDSIFCLQVYNWPCWSFRTESFQGLILQSQSLFFLFFLGIIIPRFGSSKSVFICYFTFLFCFRSHFCDTVASFWKIPTKSKTFKHYFLILINEKFLLSFFPQEIKETFWRFFY